MHTKMRATAGDVYQTVVEEVLKMKPGTPFPTADKKLGDVV